MPPAAEFRVHGEAMRTVTLRVGELARWPSHRAEVTFSCLTSGTQHHVFTGPLLRDVLTTFCPGVRTARRKERSRLLVAVTGRDCHQAVVAWAETDPEFGNAPILLAATLDGRSLESGGCQLVVPGDACGARYVSSVTGIWIGAHAFAGPTRDPRDTATGDAPPAGPAWPAHSGS
ncbi:molybdopterin-dependent oxidoreductase [Streptomyces sp. SL13]|uniref:Molybdopterin-dependent oxidoreductase n=1 Tax=Streptantibioticus silvisoli TaxID=2705255 RepID=A0AA90H7H1_9ACTN|nr:molybdopterin-dependent oxidoreductase [Streptantibioticus silvisoli]MDI5970220.1 molybdopterin-dependent oxidoreductase [Streptantibioticus silvisoli]